MAYYKQIFKRKSFHIFRDIDNITNDEIEDLRNYIEKELIKEKKKRSKLARLAIACLFGG